MSVEDNSSRKVGIEYTLVNSQEADLAQINSLDLRVSLLDPLNLDDFLLNYLPQLNRKRLSREIIRFALTKVPNKTEVSHYDPLNAKAATRDLGFIASSITRHGLKLNTIPQLEEALLTLSETTNEVPRDTVFSYGPRNPETKRMRLFTGLPEEKLFIESFRRGMKKIPDCISFLISAKQETINSPNFDKLI